MSESVAAARLVSVRESKRCPRCEILYADAACGFYRNRSNPDGLQDYCKACQKAHGKRRYWNNPEVFREVSKARSRALQLEGWVLTAAQRAKRVQSRKQYREKISQKRRMEQRQAYHEHHERELARRKAWRQANPDSTRTTRIQRRASERKAVGRATTQQIAARVAFYGDRCWICGAPWTEIDHVIPLSRGGSNWPSNLRPACKSCNSSKGAKKPQEMRA